MLYRGKEKILSEIELIIYQLKWYCPTSIISLALLVLRPKLVLPLTDVLQSYLYFYLLYRGKEKIHSEIKLIIYFCFSVLKRHGVFYTSAVPEVTWKRTTIQQTVTGKS